MPAPNILTLNGVNAVSVRLSLPWRGVWFAEVELDPDSVDAVAAFLALPTPVVLIVNGISMLGIIEPARSGVFVSRVMAMVIGGRAGWAKDSFPQHFTVPGGGLLSNVVELATGGLQGEAATDALPSVLGSDYVRVKGPSSEVIGYDTDWHVDPTTSLTLIDVPWPPLPIDPDAMVGAFEASEMRAEVHSQFPVFPGTTFVDLRVGTTPLVVRDVEQTFTNAGSVAQCWLATGGESPLADAFKTAVRAFGGTRYLKTYLYRCALGPTPKTMALQAVTPDAPDLVPFPEWTGVSGIETDLFPGTQLVVGFTGGDPSKPYIVSYEFSPTPFEIRLRAGIIPQSPTEHGISGEAVALLIYNAFAAVCTANPGPIIGASLQPLLTAAISTAIEAQSLPAPPGIPAQIAAAAAQTAQFVAGQMASTSAPFAANFAALPAVKVPNDSGLFPCIGWPGIKGG